MQKISVKAFWNTFSSIINPKRQVTDKINVDNKIVSNNTSVAEYFNKHFCNVGKKLADKVTTADQHYSTYLKNSNSNTFYLTPVDENEIINIIRNLTNNKSVGDQDIPIKVFKTCIDKLKRAIIKNY